MYLSNNCVKGTSVKEEKYYESEGMGTVQLHQLFPLTTQSGYSRKPSGLLFRDTSIFPLTIHRYLRRLQATKNIIPCIYVGHTGFLWQIRPLEI